MKVFSRILRRRQRRALGLLCALAMAACAGCDGPAGAGGRGEDEPPVAATSSYLAAACGDLLDPQAGEALVLAGPGMCPGHFDVRPSQLRALRGCELLLLFDFQSGLRRRLEPLLDGAACVQVAPGGGLCVPQSYRRTLGAVAAALVDRGLLDADTARSRVAAAGEALGRRADAARQRLAEAAPNRRTADIVVVCSGHQEEFCRWLGLEVAARFSAGDTARAGELLAAVEAGTRAGARFVIANRPEGSQAAEALAARLGAEVVIFENFPDAAAGRPHVAEVIEENVRRLRAAVEGGSS